MVSEYTRLSETFVMLRMKKFCDGVLAVFGLTYMRKALEDDVQ